jgi:sigma-B regulation protein RsbQ
MKKFKIKQLKNLILTVLFICSILQLNSCKQNNKPKEMKEIKRDNVIINYNITGNGDATLLFVHGSYIDQTYWEKQVKYFSSNYTVVTLDLPGHGKSGTKRTQWSTESFAEDVIAVIKELDLKNVILIGHSWAGDVNLIVATSYPKPIIGFIAIDFFKNAAIALSPEHQQQAASIEQKLKIDFANTNEQYARMSLLTKETPIEITNRVVKDYRNAYQPMGKEITSEIFNLLFKTEKQLLPQLKFKLFLINVDYQPTNEEPLKRYTRNGYEVLHLKGTCHYPMLENPEELNKLLQQTIQKISNISQ